MADEVFDSQQIDWLLFIKYAREQSVVPNICQALSSCANLAPPKPIVQRLNQLNRANTIGSLALSRELLAVKALLEKHEIPILAYKGPALAKQIYGNISNRHSGDLDVLLHHQDICRAVEIFFQAGYEPLEDPNDYPLKAHMRAPSRNHYTLLHPKLKIHIELHWLIGQTKFSYRLNHKRIWRNKINVDINGSLINTFGSEDLLIILCVHAAKHFHQYQSVKLKWLCDINITIIKKIAFDWTLMIQCAKSDGVLRIVYIWLLVIHRLFAPNIPSDVLDAAEREPEVSKLTDEIIDKLFILNTEEHFDHKGYAVYYRMRESLRDRFAFFLHPFKPDFPDYAEVQLPDALVFLYYLVRPWRLFRTNGVKILVSLLGYILPEKTIGPKK